MKSASDSLCAAEGRFPHMACREEVSFVYVCASTLNNVRLTGFLQRVIGPKNDPKQISPAVKQTQTYGSPIYGENYLVVFFGRQREKVRS